MKKCKDCQERYGDSLFLWLSDELWSLIGCSADDFLCAHCTIDRLEKHRSYAYLIGGAGSHIIKRANAQISMKQNGKRVHGVPVYPLGKVPKIPEKFRRTKVPSPVR